VWANSSSGTILSTTLHPLNTVGRGRARRPQQSMDSVAAVTVELASSAGRGSLVCQSSAKCGLSSQRSNRGARSRHIDSIQAETSFGLCQHTNRPAAAGEAENDRFCAIESDALRAMSVSVPPWPRIGSRLS
jgi:hypothetical protein